MLFFTNNIKINSVDVWHNPVLDTLTVAVPRCSKLLLTLATVATSPMSQKKEQRQRVEVRQGCVKSCTRTKQPY